MNKNFLIAGGVVLAIGLAVAIGVTLVDEPLDGNLPEGETTVNGDFLPEFASENDDNIARGLAAPTFSAPNQNSEIVTCLLYTSPSPRDGLLSRMPSSA